MNGASWQRRLTDLGMVRPAAAGIQLDLNTVIRARHRVIDNASLCDHNCTTEHGHYTCPSALSLNAGLRTHSLPSAAQVLTGVDVAVAALHFARRRFLAGPFDAYCDRFRVQEEVARILRRTIETGPVEVNLSGGNPELHPQLPEMLAGLRQRGLLTNLTTTGRRVMRDAGFLERLLEQPPDVIAFSADDFSNVAQVRELRGMTAERLKALWRQIPRGYGQRQKAVEAVYAATLLTRHEGPAISFNLVVHQGNLHQVEALVRTLGEAFPGCQVFPYPAQTAFLGLNADGSAAARMEVFIDRMLEVHTEGGLSMTRRLQYWLALKAACRVYAGDPGRLDRALGGEGLWHCQREGLANRYLQVGGSAHPVNFAVGGGYLGCAWNPRAARQGEAQLWELGPADVAQRIDHRVPPAAGALACPGCAFPRLLFDVVNTELGLDPTLISPYLELRRQYVGY